MDEPTVTSLHYKLKHTKSVTFKNPPAVEGEWSGFRYQLKDGKLTITLPVGDSNFQRAMQVVDPWVRSWEIAVFDTETGKVTVGNKVHPARPNTAVVSPDNSYLAVEAGHNAEEKPEVLLYAMSTDQQIAHIPLAKWGHPIGFTPDGKTFLVGGSEFVIYESESGKKVRSLTLLDGARVEHDWHR